MKYIIIFFMLVCPLGFHFNAYAAFGTEEEQKQGYDTHLQIISSIGQYHAPKIEAYLSSIGKKLAPSIGISSKYFKFFILDSDIVNAFAAPGGYIYVTRGLLLYTNSEAQLAGVLAHEIAHVYLHHSTRLQNTKLLIRAGTLLTYLTLGPVAAAAGVIGDNPLMAASSRKYEKEADKLALNWLINSGYNPEEFIRFMKTLRRYESLESSNDEIFNPLKAILQTHPPTEDRIKYLKSLAFSAKSSGYSGAKEHLEAIDGMKFSDGVVPLSIKIHEAILAEDGLHVQCPKNFFFFSCDQELCATNGRGGIATLKPIPMGYYSSLDSVLRREAFNEDINLAGDVTKLSPLSAIAKYKDKGFLAIIKNQSPELKGLLIKLDNLDFHDAREFVINTHIREYVVNGADGNFMKVQIYKATGEEDLELLAASQYFGPFSRERFMIINGFFEGSKIKKNQLIKTIGL